MSCIWKFRIDSSSVLEMGGIEEPSTQTQPERPPSSAIAVARPLPDERQPVISSSKRIPALDGLRGIAILLVLIAHSFLGISFVNPTLNWCVHMTRLSWSGVDLFFVLSGFLIGGILLDARDSQNYFKTFYIRRAYRILPVYGLVLALAWLTFQAGQIGWLQGAWAEIFSGKIKWWTFFTFTQNIFMAMAGPYVGRASLSQTWSLAVEEQFYLTLPLLIRYASRRTIKLVVVGFIVGAALLRVFLMFHFSNGAYASYVLMPCRADALGFGVLSAILVRDEQAWCWLGSHRIWLYGAAGLLGFGLLLICLSSFEVFSTMLYGTEYSILALFYTSWLLIAVTGEDGFVKAVLCNAPLMKLGLIAYGTYLMHRFFLHAFHLGLASVFTSASVAYSLFSCLLGIGVTLLIAQVSWTWFEKPLVRRGHHYHY